MRERTVYLFIIFLCITETAYSNVWQWSVPVRNVISSETNEAPVAFLWIPEDCKEVKGVILAQHNMLEEGILENKTFRKSMSRLGFAEIWVSPAFDISFNFNENAPEILDGMMKDLAEQSGYSELISVPVIPIGHSALASYPWNFAAWNPERTLAVISLKGDAPQTNLTGSGRPNPDWGDRNIDGIPGLMIMGEYEWWEDRLKPGLGFVDKHPNSPITWFTDAGKGHFDYSEQLILFLCLYIEKAVEARLHVDSGLSLKPVNVEDGFLMPLWSKDASTKKPIALYSEFGSDKSQASWVISRSLGRKINAIYKRSSGKAPQYLGFSQKNQILPAQNNHAVYNLSFDPQEDGVTFNVSSFFTDSSRTNDIGQQRQSRISIDKICGPVKKIDDTTFRISHYRIGLNNPKRSNEIWLLASSEGDKKHKSAVQQANLRFPLKNTAGREQKIKFNHIENQHEGRQQLRLSASSDAGLKVDFYVKSGPAVVDSGLLRFTKIPPSAKFPVKVTVVAWQYGTSKRNKVQSALPVERSFYITK